jgi:hypothetical protein
MATTFASKRLRWRENSLHLDGKGHALIQIVSEERYAGMWRVRLPDGRLTDMLNRTRAKDAAVSLALAWLNRREAA